MSKFVKNGVKSVERGIDMRESEIIRILKSDRNLYGECFSCLSSFQLAKAELFYGDCFTPQAKERVEEWTEKLEERIKQLREKQKTARERATKATTSVNVGKGLIRDAEELLHRYGYEFRKVER